MKFYRDSLVFLKLSRSLALNNEQNRYIGIEVVLVRSLIKLSIGISCNSKIFIPLPDYQAKNRRYYDYEDEPSCLRLIRYSGIPFLYILAVCANIVGMICMGIITDYWANSENPTCFLYSQVW